ncbi:hypothetical protein CQR49_0474 [Bifidobacterium pseudolongum subsp. pseudolongum]|uniref:hypothetical protein n=1 Tax=Bifidobacterium pseudolongum TaxID=1694 RepID=UPI000C705407|nr:hypothetical protein [Bifidobacterium pseudolongum]PKV08918.1 hypothetical protein CQR49_0474 [Bifidobacterium pseudolongum subsp. pseudolongum]
MSKQPNINLQASISRAIAVRAARLGRTLKSIRLAAGYPTTTFQDRYKGRRPWNTNDVDRLAKALDLPDGFALYAIARREAGLSDS